MEAVEYEGQKQVCTEKGNFCISTFYIFFTCKAPSKSVFWMVIKFISVIIINLIFLSIIKFIYHYHIIYFLISKFIYLFLHLQFFCICMLILWAGLTQSIAWLL